MNKLLSIVLLAFLLISCSKDSENDYETIDPATSIQIAFGTNIDLNNLENYANQTIPSYVLTDNTDGNPITDKEATLGRVLFYDKNLSSNNTISCASCHKQELAFGDDAMVSQGVNGTSDRHSMRLVNNRFSLESKYFWDERASSLEEQTIMPIQDHKEMGFSGQNGDPNFSELITKLNSIGYYKELFKFVYGSENIDVEKIKVALSQFVRSIQSFDSKYDVGRASVSFDTDEFPNYTRQEERGKNLFLLEAFFNSNGDRTSGGLACLHCHQTPTFNIDPTSKNNGIIGVIGSPNQIDLNNTKAPSLRNIFNQNGQLNGPLMHTGNLTLEDVLNHYSTNPENSLNTNLDIRLFPNGNTLKLNMTTAEKNDITAFLKTLSGTNVYTDAKWSDPFLN